MSRFNTKCEKCKMHYQGFHICVDLEAPEPKLKKEVAYIGPKRTYTRRSKSGLSASEAQTLRWAAHHELMKDRNDEIIAWYAEGNIGYKEIKEKYKISQTSIQKILKAGEADGRIKIRKRGGNMRWNKS